MTLHSFLYCKEWCWFLFSVFLWVNPLSTVRSQTYSIQKVKNKKKSTFNHQPIRKQDFPGTRTKEDPFQLFERFENLRLENILPFESYVDFIEQHPDWPFLNDLQKKAEKTLEYKDSTLSNQHKKASLKRLHRIEKFFKKYPPLSAHGQFIFSRTLLSLGKKAQAKLELFKLINHFKIPNDLLPFIPAYKEYLPFYWAEQQVNYLLLYEKVETISSITPYLTVKTRDRLTTRFLLQQKESQAVEKAYQFLKTSGNNQGLVFDLVRYHASFDTAEEDEKAYDLLKKYTLLDEVLHPHLYWKIRHKLARNFLKKGEFNKAYFILKKNGYMEFKLSQPNPLKCSEECISAITTTSWVGIQYRFDVLRSLTHLKDIQQIPKSPITKARIFFWIARGHIQLNQWESAYAALKKASYFKSTFYGQAALSILKKPEFQRFEQQDSIKKRLPKDNLFPKANISLAQKKAFGQLDLVRVIRSVPKALSKENSLPFFSALLNLDYSIEFHDLVFNLAKEKKGEAFAVLLSKAKHMTFRSAYPLLKSQTFKQSVDLISKKTIYKNFLPALSHAIIRRESAFDENAISPANAKGLMQMLQSTAEAEASIVFEKFGLSFQRPIDLFQKKTNLILGTSHLATLLDEFQGSLILAIAAYNAGKNNVLKWIDLYGDPRDIKKVDPLNWIELIPFYETRNYVQRVLENFTLYEQLLHEQSNEVFEIDLLRRLQQ